MHALAAERNHSLIHPRAIAPSAADSKAAAENKTS